METSDPPKSRSARQFVMMGVQLQEALKTGNALDASLDAFCREAFARKDLAQSISFLLSLVDKNVVRLSDLLKPRHLVAELSVGSQILSSLVAAHWDKVEKTDRLAQLADGILAAHKGGTSMNSAGEFSAALAKTIAVLHPHRAKALLEMATPMVSGPDSASLLKEAWDWQKAGELLAGKDMEFRKFWHQTLRQQRGDWFWDTAEGRRALAGLDTGEEDLNLRGGLFRRSVPAWAWQPGEDKPGEAFAETAPAALPPTHRLPQEPLAEVAAAPEASPPRSNNQGSSLLVIGSLGLLACTAVIVAATQIDLPQFLPAPVVGPKTVAEAIVQPTPAAPTTAVAPASTIASAAPTIALESTAPIKAVTAVQLVPAIITNRQGWIKTPLGAEFQVTPLNTVSGRITDGNGQVWQLPADPELVAQVKIGNQVVNPYNGETITLTTAELTPGRSIPYGKTGWTYRLPEVLPVKTVAANHRPSAVNSTDDVPELSTPPVVTAVPPSPAPTQTAAIETKSAAASTAQSLSILAAPRAPAAPPAMARPDTALEAPATKTPEVEAKPAGTAGSPAPTVAEPPSRVRGDTPSATKPGGSGASAPSRNTKARPATKKCTDTNKAVAARRPSEASAAHNVAFVSTRTRQQLGFVTRANSIRMNYKGGYWESPPGAYLTGAGETPAEWARDMTLRERSSGTIPEGYMFKVLDRGVVRILPQPPAK